MSLQVFSIFQSGKNGVSEEVDLARKIVSNTKAGRLNFLDKFHEIILSEEQKVLLKEFIPPNSTLIPLPKSAPLVDDAQWPPMEICKFLVNRGYGNTISPYLKRIKKVPKAAYQANSDDRPTVLKHYETIEVDNNEIFTPDFSEIILVDDVVTQGRMGYACFQRISEAYPDIPVKLFSLIRTNSFSRITKCVDPKNTEILYYPDSGKTFHSVD